MPSLRNQVTGAYPSVVLHAETGWLLFRRQDCCVSRTIPSTRRRQERAKRRPNSPPSPLPRRLPHATRSDKSHPSTHSPQRGKGLLLGTEDVRRLCANPSFGWGPPKVRLDGGLIEGYTNRKRACMVQVDRAGSVQVGVIRVWRGAGAHFLSASRALPHCLPSAPPDPLGIQHRAPTELRIALFSDCTHVRLERTRTGYRACRRKTSWPPA